MDTASRSGVWELSKANQDGERLRVIVADDDPLARRVVRDTLQGASIVVVAEATTAARRSSSRSTTAPTSSSWTW
jgi:hypothetical protein